MQLTEHLTSSKSLRSAKKESELSSSLSLTAHFNLSEFERSSTASRLGIDNSIPEALIPNIKNLCVQVLEPLRAHIQTPVLITSGYRCRRLNKAVGGIWNSQHLAGEAADIQPMNCHFNLETRNLKQLENREKRSAILRSWAAWITDNCNFDQLILEKSGTTMWLHVSCKIDIAKNRRQVIVSM